MRQKLADTKGLTSLAGQVALDVSVLVSIYLPVFYVLKSLVFTGGTDPVHIVKTGLTNLKQNWARDGLALTKTWVPFDLMCFSVPLWLRLPMRHFLSFFWTTYFSFLAGANKKNAQK